MNVQFSLLLQYHDWGVLEQGTEPPTAPRALEQWLPTAPGVCSQCVCSLLTAVCVHLDGLNAEDQFRVWVTILDNTSHLFIIYYSRVFLGCAGWVARMLPGDCLGSVVSSVDFKGRFWVEFKFISVSSMCVMMSIITENNHIYSNDINEGRQLHRDKGSKQTVKPQAHPNSLSRPCEAAYFIWSLCEVFLS